MPGLEPSVSAVPFPGVELGTQTRPPDATVQVETTPGGLADALSASQSAAADWVWLVGPDVAPEATALEALLAPLARLEALGHPVLFSGKVVGRDGRLDLERPPWPRLLARELAMTGADHRLAALRAARYGSLLIHGRAIELHGPPRADFAGDGADLEWTSRILRDEPGYLVPKSIAVREGARSVDAAAFTRNRVRILRGDGWRGQEKAWFAFLLGQELVQRTVERPAAAPRLAAAVLSGLRAPA